MRSSLVKLVPLEDEYKYTQGFRSVYAYNEETKLHIEATNSTANLSDHDVYSDMLFVDFDSFPDSAKKLAIHLNNMKVKYYVYVSGNRSFHFHIPIVPMYGKDVPFSQKQWIINNSENADLSFYHSSGQFRLIGTKHYKTGKYKGLLYDHNGSILNINVQQKPKFQPLPKCVIGSSDDTEHYELMLLSVKYYEGNRRNTLFKIIMEGLRVGIPTKQLIYDAIMWGRDLPTPLSDMEVTIFIEPMIRKHREDYNE